MVFIMLILLHPAIPINTPSIKTVKSGGKDLNNTYCSTVYRE